MASEGWQCPQCRACYSPATPQCFNCTGSFSSSSGTSCDVPLSYKIEGWLCKDGGQWELEDSQNAFKGMCHACHKLNVLVYPVLQ